MTISEFIESYREAFGDAAPLPIAFAYNIAPATEIQHVPKCMIGAISKVLHYTRRRSLQKYDISKHFGFNNGFTKVDTKCDTSPFNIDDTMFSDSIRFTPKNSPSYLNLVYKKKRSPA